MANLRITCGHALSKLRYHMDIQLSAKQVLVVKIYEKDSAAAILANLKKQSALKSLDIESFKKIEHVIRTHASR